MPSPLGHAIAGAATGWVVTGACGRPEGPAEIWRWGALFALLGMLPDVDLLFGAHSGPTHSLGSAVIVGLAAYALSGKSRIGFAAATAYASHTLLDWLGTDSSPPIGIMALWPLSREYYQSGLHVFHAISRRYWLPEIWEHNSRAVARELLILMPAALLILVLQRRRLRTRRN